MIAVSGARLARGLRLALDEYTAAFLAAGLLALVAAAAVLLIRSARAGPPVPAPVM